MSNKKKLNTLTAMKIVKESYPEAYAINISTIASNSYFVIMNNKDQLGKGKNRRSAWVAASRNINQ